MDASPFSLLPSLSPLPSPSPYIHIHIRVARPSPPLPFPSPILILLALAHGAAAPFLASIFMYACRPLSVLFCLVLNLNLCPTFCWCGLSAEAGVRRDE
ncbi:hypothetical protein B0H14DRAFT_1278945 [Mycena olivaceomarginata]|nr:hypothetical protein B0H14DRAFT_1278945 [Mycena olivaceomarginata]